MYKIIEFTLLYKMFLANQNQNQSMHFCKMHPVQFWSAKTEPGPLLADLKWTQSSFGWPKLDLVHFCLTKTGPGPLLVRWVHFLLPKLDPRSNFFCHNWTPRSSFFPVQFLRDRPAMKPSAVGYIQGRLICC